MDPNMFKGFDKLMKLGIVVAIALQLTFMGLVVYGLYYVVSHLHIWFG